MPAVKIPSLSPLTDGHSVIAVTFSLPDESRDFLRTVQISNAKGRGVGSFVEGICEGQHVLVWHVGIGALSARVQMGRLFSDRKPSIVICAGYAGALVEGLQLGEVIFDQRKADEVPEFLLPVGTQRGRIVTVASVVEGCEGKRRLGIESGALAVDMETEVIAEACTVAGVPVVALRSISDRVQDALPIPMQHWFDLEKQRPAVGALLKHLLCNPNKIAPFVRFVRSLKPAREALAVALVEVIAQLGSPRRG